jgi:cbb3-type cytochrome oxidase subunit 3
MIDKAIDFLAAQGPLIVLPAFMAIFFAFGFWAYRPKNKSMMNDIAQIPLKESHDGD